ncbi:GTPase-associated protein 1-related protein [Streptomyces racemochromogenes]|uniref:GTPase-associated protein 1-related protein n=1 Tax=Streptomyces racemochromogenes TaxID=67353 RepID=A0ABW7P7D3_9ACTN
MSLPQLHYEGGSGFTAVTPGVSAALLREAEPLLGYEPPPGGDRPEALSLNVLSDGSRLLARAVRTGAGFHAHAVHLPGEARGALPVTAWGSAGWRERTPADGPPPALDRIPPPGPYDREAMAGFVAARGPWLAAFFDDVRRAAEEPGAPRVVLVEADPADVARWVMLACGVLPHARGQGLGFTTYTRRPLSAPQRLVGVLPQDAGVLEGGGRRHRVYETARGPAPEAPRGPAALWARTAAAVWRAGRADVFAQVRRLPGEPYAAGPLAALALAAGVPLGSAARAAAAEWAAGHGDAPDGVRTHALPAALLPPGEDPSGATAPQRPTTTRNAKPNPEPHHTLTAKPEPEAQDTLTAKPDPQARDTLAPEPEPGARGALTAKPDPEAQDSLTTGPDPRAQDTLVPEPEPGARGALTAEPEPEAQDTLTAEPDPQARDTLAPEPEPGARGALTAEPEPEAPDTLTAEPGRGARGALTAKPEPGAPDALRTEPEPGARGVLGAEAGAELRAVLAGGGGEPDVPAGLLPSAAAPDAGAAGLLPQAARKLAWALLADPEGAYGEEVRAALAQLPALRALVLDRLDALAAGDPAAGARLFGRTGFRLGAAEALPHLRMCARGRPAGDRVVALDTLLREAGVSPYAEPLVLRTGMRLVWADEPPTPVEARLLLATTGAAVHRRAGTWDLLARAATEAPPADPYAPELASELLRHFGGELPPDLRDRLREGFGAPPPGTSG